MSRENTICPIEPFQPRSAILVLLGSSRTDLTLSIMESAKKIEITKALKLFRNFGWNFRAWQSIILSVFHCPNGPADNSIKFMGMHSLFDCNSVLLTALKACPTLAYDVLPSLGAAWLQETPWSSLSRSWLGERSSGLGGGGGGAAGGKAVAPLVMVEL